MSRHSLPDLLALMQRLRAECPWDRVQTPQSLSRYAIEEAYEVDAAIRDGDSAHIRDELGDLLLQVVFHSQMASEEGRFVFNDCVRAIVEKLVGENDDANGSEPRPENPCWRPFATARYAFSGFRFRYRKVWGFKSLLVHSLAPWASGALGET